MDYTEAIEILYNDLQNRVNKTKIPDFVSEKLNIAIDCFADLYNNYNDVKDKLDKLQALVNSLDSQFTLVDKKELEQFRNEYFKLWENQT